MWRIGRRGPLSEGVKQENGRSAGGDLEGATVRSGETSAVADRGSDDLLLRDLWEIALEHWPQAGAAPLDVSRVTWP